MAADNKTGKRVSFAKKVAGDIRTESIDTSPTRRDGKDREEGPKSAEKAQLP
jgi:hypothetical protein